MEGCYALQFALTHGRDSDDFYASCSFCFALTFWRCSLHRVGDEDSVSFSQEGAAQPASGFSDVHNTERPNLPIASMEAQIYSMQLPLANTNVIACSEFADLPTFRLSI